MYYRGIYLDAFAAQREPLEAWHAALRGRAAYTLTVRLAIEGEEVVGGIHVELYPRSQVGLVTYMVVAPAARERGLGRALLEGAVRDLYARGARVVLGEVNDPRVHGEAAAPRLERFLRWGARRIDVPYVQPALGEGLARDEGLCLIALPPVLREISHEDVRAFIDEIHAAHALASVP